MLWDRLIAFDIDAAPLGALTRVWNGAR